MGKLATIDLFCGGGGASHGFERSGACELVLGLNHNATAIKTHSRNFPHAKHINSSIAKVSPAEHRGKCHFLFAAPACTHHANARGGRPMQDQERSMAEDCLPWIDYHRPEFFMFENVREFRTWGPLTKAGRPHKRYKGKFFEKWLQDLDYLGYDVEHRLMNAADFGAATSRIRLFVVGRRRGRKKRALPWADPTHDKNGAGGLPFWRPAYEIIDWDIPCPSIFSRKRVLKDKTLLRIEAGLRKFVEPFVVKFRANEFGESLWDPVSTVTAGGRHHGIIIPVQYQLIGRGAGRSRDASDPVPTIVAQRENHGFIAPYIVPKFGERQGQEPRTHGVGDPHPTVTASNSPYLAVPYMVKWDNTTKMNGYRGSDEPLYTMVTKNNQGLVLPFISKQFGMKGASSHGNNVTDPLGTVTTVDHHALLAPYLVRTNHGDDGHTGSRLASPLDPLGTVTGKAGQYLAVPFLQQYYGTQQYPDLQDPLPTIVSKARTGLGMAIIQPFCPDWPEPQSAAMEKLQSTMRELGVMDIGFRMFMNSELSRAMGFDDDYVFEGSKSQITKQIGNSVSPSYAEQQAIAIAAA